MLNKAFDITQLSTFAFICFLLLYLVFSSPQVRSADAKPQLGSAVKNLKIKSNLLDGNTNVENSLHSKKSALGDRQSNVKFGPSGLGFKDAANTEEVEQTGKFGPSGLGFKQAGKFGPSGLGFKNSDSTVEVDQVGKFGPNGLGFKQVAKFGPSGLGFKKSKNSREIEGTGKFGPSGLGFKKAEKFGPSGLGFKKADEVTQQKSVFNPSESDRNLKKVSNVKSKNLVEKKQKKKLNVASKHTLDSRKNRSTSKSVSSEIRTANIIAKPKITTKLKPKALTNIKKLDKKKSNDAIKLGTVKLN